MWAGGKWTTGMEREGFRAALPEQLRSHIEDAEQTPLIEFRLDGPTVSLQAPWDVT